VENKKINVTFYLVVMVFLVFILILIKDFKLQKANEFKEYAATITNIVKRDNYRLRMLSRMLVAQEKENADLKNTLADTRNSLDALSKKLAQPTPVAVPAASPAAAVPTK